MCAATVGEATRSARSVAVTIVLPGTYYVPGIDSAMNLLLVVTENPRKLFGTCFKN